MAEFINAKERKNILIGHLFRNLLKNNTDIKKKKIYLNNAFFHLENITNTNRIPFFINNNHDVDIKEGYELSVKSNEQTWKLLLKGESELSLTATEKSKYGFEVKYGDINGFLPNSLIKERILKNYPIGKCDFTISAKCELHEMAFNYFIASQDEKIINQKPAIYNQKFQIGKFYEGYIKDTHEHGVFISTICGEGFLHKKNIFDFSWDYNQIPILFKKGTKIKVHLIKKDELGRYEFDFIKNKEIDEIYYKDFGNSIFKNDGFYNIDTTPDYEDYENTEETDFDKCQFEMALCFEDNVALQNSISSKLQNLRIARYYYSNVKNARSFLLNIYVDFFQIVEKIEVSINQRSIAEFSKIKELAKNTMDSIDKRTISSFSDAENVIKFLEIISLFNDNNEKSNTILYDFLSSFNDSKKHRYLKIIAKITLANNLLIQESKIEEDFCLKNLSKILDFINSGILNLSETIQDKYEQELKEQILYWRKKIENDENTTLEFKSSLFTPIRVENGKEKNKKDKSQDISESEIKNKLIHSSMKSLAGFANTDGGTLIIGVNNDKIILGLENEFSVFPDSKDGYGKHFDNLIKIYFGDGFSSFLTKTFLKFPEGEVLIIEVKKCQEEIIFLKKDDQKKDKEQLFIRRLSSTIEIAGSEMVRFIKSRELL